MGSDITQLLAAADRGDPHAADQILPLVYAQLRELAHARLAHERPGHTLQPTALVHEAYLRLIGPNPDAASPWAGRAHFFAAAAESMRRILIDHARARLADKRGGGAARAGLPPDALPLSMGDAPGDLLDLDEAIAALDAEDPQKARLVKLRFFAGLTLDQAARVLDLSPATADRHWAYAKAWLYARMSK